MRNRKEMFTAVGAVALAIGIGFVMQSGDTARERYGDRAAPGETRASVVTGAVTIADVSDVVLTSAQQPELSAIEALATERAQPSSFLYSAARGCNIQATSQVRPGALVEISIEAPCLLNKSVTMHHMGLMFKVETDAQGYANVQVPAMAASSIIVIVFENGDGAVLQAVVPDIYNFRRTAIQWRGKADLDLATTGFGADDAQGFITRLGDPSLDEPVLATVYTSPAQSNEVDVMVTSPVELSSCGTDLDVQSFVMRYGRVRTDDLTLSLPDCESDAEVAELTKLMKTLP
jgi:hypothetical protein